MAVLEPDICVVGAGSAGLTVAAAAAAFGVPVVLAERHRMGGDCLNVGCVPSKALLAAARRAKAVREAPAFGIGTSEPDIDFSAVHAHVHRVIAAIAPNDGVPRFTALGVKVLRGEARFLDRETLAVGDLRIRPRRTVLATGSRPALPPIAGLDTVPVLTNETVFDLTERPQRLIVIGAGAIGLELAQAFARLGASVTVLEASNPLEREDPEAVAVVLRALAQDGVVVRTKVAVASVAGQAGAITVTLADGQTVVASHLLVATGRRPVTEGLGLAEGGVAFGPKGITVDASLRTSNPNVYAIGDCTGLGGLTHTASYHAGIVLRRLLFRLPVKADPDLIPRVTYTEPELAQAGLTEREARARHGKIAILRWPFAENDRAQTERETQGFAKLITDPRGRLLGTTIVAAGAGEQIGLYTLTIRKGHSVRDLSDLVLPYPTFGEAGKRAATAFFTPAVANPWVRRVIAGLRKLG